MNRIYLIGRRIFSLALLAAFWLGMQSVLLAAPAKPPAPSGGESSQSWVGPYALLLMAVGLGMLVVCRSTRRSDRAKPKEYQSLTEAK